MRVLFASLSIAAPLLLGGCSSKEPIPEKEIVYRVSDRQLPPEDTYNRLRWVHLPETHPVRNLELVKHRNRPKLLPVVHFTIEDGSICDAATMLAGLGRYSSYCSSLLKEKKISLNTLGTMEEIGLMIEEAHGISVVIDHENREVRFLSQQSAEVRFFEEGGHE
ncbi:MAG: hypothetical protein KDD70_02505 [Bdellovibrionales bacterium]|nr:hypothetical protein [Bdellovibrionales bacterium]